MLTAARLALTAVLFLGRELMALLNREAIEKKVAEGPPTETVPVPAWGGEVLVRGMTGRQRDRFEAGLLERRGRHEVTNVDNIRTKVVVQCVIGEDGERLWADHEADELGETAGADAINSIYTVAAKLSGISNEDLEELAGVIAGDPSTGSPSSSPGPSAVPAATNSSDESTPMP
jgi:hypothetical protein